MLGGFQKQHWQHLYRAPWFASPPNWHESGFATGAGNAAGNIPFQVLHWLTKRIILIDFLNEGYFCRGDRESGLFVWGMRGLVTKFGFCNHCIMEWQRQENRQERYAKHGKIQSPVSVRTKLRT